MLPMPRLAMKFRKIMVLSNSKFATSRLLEHSESVKDNNGKCDSCGNGSEKSSNETEDLKYILGSKINKGKGDPSRPVFVPQETEAVDIDQLEPPTNCCMTGCPNCVWIEYAENLAKAFSHPELTKDRLRKELDLIEDQNIKAFVMMELRIKGLL